MAAKKRPVVKFDTVPIEKRELLRAAEAASLVLGVSENVWRKWRDEELIPKPVVLLSGRQLWRRVELLDWVAAGCPQQSAWRWEPNRLGMYENLIREAQGKFQDLNDEINQLGEKKAAIEVEIKSLQEQKQHEQTMGRLQR